MNPDEREKRYRAARDRIEEASTLIEQVRWSDKLPMGEAMMCESIIRNLEDALLTLLTEAERNEEDTL